MAKEFDILESAIRYFRPHAWVYGIALLAAAVLALISGGLWFFWPLMVWTILFLLHLLVVKSASVSDDWVAERAAKTAVKAYDLGHIESIRERQESDSARPEDADSAEDSEAGAEDRRA
jgi:hypothetical protein